MGKRNTHTLIHTCVHTHTHRVENREEIREKRDWGRDGEGMGRTGRENRNRRREKREEEKCQLSSEALGSRWEGYMLSALIYTYQISTVLSCHWNPNTIKCLVSQGSLLLNKEQTLHKSGSGTPVVVCDFSFLPWEMGKFIFEGLWLPRVHPDQDKLVTHQFISRLLPAVSIWMVCLGHSSCPPSDGPWWNHRWGKCHGCHQQNCRPLPASSPVQG